MGGSFAAVFVGIAIAFELILSGFSPSYRSSLDPDLLMTAQALLYFCCPGLSAVLLGFGLLFRKALQKEIAPTPADQKD